MTPYRTNAKPEPEKGPGRIAVLVARAWLLVVASLIVGWAWLAGPPSSVFCPWAVLGSLAISAAVAWVIFWANKTLGAHTEKDPAP